jgi:hypothetical protein
VEHWVEKFSLQVVGELQLADCPALAPLKRGEWMTAAADETEAAEWDALWRDKLACQQPVNAGVAPVAHLECLL